MVICFFKISEFKNPSCSACVFITWFYDSGNETLQCVRLKSLTLASNDNFYVPNCFSFTGETPDDPLTGFLPPNNGTTGQGYVSFTVRLKKNAQSLARIDAKASIYFDKNEPIDTPPIFNTVRSLIKPLRLRDVNTGWVKEKPEKAQRTVFVVLKLRGRDCRIDAGLDTLRSKRWRR